MARIARLLLIIVWANSTASAQSAAIAEKRTIRYFESIRRQPSLQLAFLREMPKGGDLHNHLKWRPLRRKSDRLCRKRQLVRGSHDRDTHCSAM